MIYRRSPRHGRKGGRSGFALVVVFAAWGVGLAVSRWVSPYLAILASVSFLAVGFVVEWMVFRKRSEARGFPIDGSRGEGQRAKDAGVPPSEGS
jgi:hypothetical protein